MSQNNCPHEAWEEFGGGARVCADCRQPLPKMQKIEIKPAPLRFALVPNKETPEMVSAFNGEEVSFFDDAYTAMLAASPGNDLLQRIARALENHAHILSAGGYPVASDDVYNILNELGHSHVSGT